MKITIEKLTAYFCFVMEVIFGGPSFKYQMNVFSIFYYASSDPRMDDKMLI